MQIRRDKTSFKGIDVLLWGLSKMVVYGDNAI